MKILISGDIFVGDKFQTKKMIDISVQELFSHADYRIVNLEAPITNASSKNKIIKTGPHLRMSEQTSLLILKQLNIDGVTLANNHILDYGTNGLLDTLNSLEKNNITYIGAGVNLKEAARYITLEKDGMSIAIINFCENEWSIAGEATPGANPMDIIDNANQIKAAKATHDIVICIIHGGHEYYNLPSPRMQKQYRFYADQGADIVVGHHTHCISGNEVYNGVPIYYSLGNFLFTMDSKNNDWYIGLILEVNITNKGINCQIHPVKQGKDNFNLTLIDGIDKESVLNRIDVYCKLIKDSDVLYENWEKYIVMQSKQYLNYWSPLSSITNTYIQGIFKKLGINFYNKKAASLHLNLMRCEAHHNLSMEILEKFISK